MKIGDKRAQQSTWFLIALGLGLLILIVVGLGTTETFGFVFDIFKSADIDTTLMSQKCSSLVSIGAGYCTERTEIRKNAWITCDYAVKELGVEIDGTAPECDNDDLKAICNKLKLEQGDGFGDGEKFEVNGETCKTILGLSETQ